MTNCFTPSKRILRWESAHHPIGAGRLSNLPLLDREGFACVGTIGNRQYFKLC